MSTTASRSHTRVIDPCRPRLLTVKTWVQHPDADRYELIDGVLRTRMVNIHQLGGDEFHCKLLAGLRFAIGRLWMGQH